MHIFLSLYIDSYHLSACQAKAKQSQLLAERKQQITHVSTKRFISVCSMNRRSFDLTTADVQPNPNRQTKKNFFRKKSINWSLCLSLISHTPFALYFIVHVVVIVVIFIWRLFGWTKRWVICFMLNDHWRLSSNWFFSFVVGQHLNLIEWLREDNKRMAIFVQHPQHDDFVGVVIGVISTSC